MCVPRSRPIPRDENLIPLDGDGFELSVPREIGLGFDCG
jgi:hypothetical protein